MVIDNFKLYKSMNLDTSVLDAIDCISSSTTDNFTVNPTPSTTHHVKMKTKRLRKKLYKNPHRYYDKAFADMLVYIRAGNEVQLKITRAMCDVLLYGGNGSRLTIVEPDKSVGAATTNDDGLAGMYSKRLH